MTRAEELEAEVAALRACVPEDPTFMGYWRYLRGRGPKPPGTACCICGLPCDVSGTPIFAVPIKFSTPRYRPEDGHDAMAHAMCCLAAYRGRFEMVERMLREDKPVAEIREWLDAWPWTPEEASARLNQKAQSDG